MFGKEKMPSIEGEMKKQARKEELQKIIDGLIKQIVDIENWDAHMAYEGDSFRNPPPSGRKEKLKELREQLEKASQEKDALDQG